MSESRFTNRELTAMFARLEEKLDEHSETHGKILEQVIFTNGKVKKLYLIVTAIGAFALSNTNLLFDFVKFIV